MVCWFLLFISETEESLQREATAHGFASITAYIKHRDEQDPKMCRIAYEQYKEVKLCLL